MGSERGALPSIRPWLRIRVGIGWLIFRGLTWLGISAFGFFSMRTVGPDALEDPESFFARAIARLIGALLGGLLSFLLAYGLYRRMSVSAVAFGLYEAANAMVAANSGRWIGALMAAVGVAISVMAARGIKVERESHG